MTTLRLRAWLFCAAAAALSFGAANASADVRVGVQVTLPRDHVQVRVGRDAYEYHRGIFYRPSRGGYVVVRAPRGAVIHTLPFGYARVIVSGRVYYRYADVYYQEAPSGYVVIDPPPPVTVVNTPAVSTPPPAPQPPAYQSIWLGDREYLFRDGQFFVKTSEGLVWQPAPVGAVTKTLPADATPVWYQEVEFFDSDGTIFRKTPEGYKVVPAPWTPVPAK